MQLPDDNTITTYFVNIESHMQIYNFLRNCKKNALYSNLNKIIFYEIFWNSSICFRMFLNPSDLAVTNLFVQSAQNWWQLTPIWRITFVLILAKNHSGVQSLIVNMLPIKKIIVNDIFKKFMQLHLNFS